MTGSARTIPVMAAPLFDPGQARRNIEVMPGASLLDIVRLALPGLDASDYPRLRAVLSDERASRAVPCTLWHLVRPRPGVHVILHMVPGNNTLRSVLLVVVSVAATALAPGAAGLLGLTGKVGTAIATVGLTVAGSLLVNALIPIQTPEADDDTRRNTYALSGWRNDVRRGAPVPFALGRHRYSPPFAATSYTEIVGEEQYIRALFTFGYGPLSITDLKLGDSPLDEFDLVETEIREGHASDDPVTLYPRQVLEEATNTELVRPLPRDPAGQVIEGDPAVETPVTRYTATDTDRVSVILGFPGGLFRVDDAGNVLPHTVDIRLQMRRDGAGPWITVDLLQIQAESRDPIHRQHIWQLPSRGRWQIEITRMTDETEETTISDRCVLAAIQSIRPEYPVNMDKPLALVAMRIRASHQLNGALDDFNAVIQRRVLDWNGTAWVEGLSRNPASAYVAALQGPANPFPVADAEIDWDEIADWHEFSNAKGLKYDRVHDSPEGLGQMLAAICAAGRATRRHDGLKWGVVIDRPRSLVVDHISQRNASDISWSRSYLDPPDAFRVPFLDETQGYEQAERIVPWPGHSGPIDLTETLEQPGKTDPDEIWIETRRRQYELIHRPDRITAVQDGAVRHVTRGDLVRGSFGMFDGSRIAGRVKTVTGALVELDEIVAMEAGTDYGLRFRHFADGEDVVGVSVLRPVATRPGETRVVQLTGGDARMPAIGEVVHFGALNHDSEALIVSDVEPGENMSGVLTMLPAAPVIDTLTDAEVPPPWNGRVGTPIVLPGTAPGVPRVVAILSGNVGTDAPGDFRVLVSPDPTATTPTAEFRLEYREAGTTPFSADTFPAANGGTYISGFAAGTVIELRVIAIAADVTESDPTGLITHTIGATNAPLPHALDPASISVTGGMGHAAISVATAADPALAQIQIYRVPSGGTLDRTLHAAGTPFAAAGQTTIDVIDGDTTRTNMLANPAFADASAWSRDANWAIAGGSATHTAGATDSISQSLSLVDGRAYRIRFAVTGRTAGDLTPKLVGGAGATGTARAADGTYVDRMVAGDGSATLAFAASSTFDGSIDGTPEVICIEETAACAEQGIWDYYLEPQNANGDPGPPAGPFAATVI